MSTALIFVIIAVLLLGLFTSLAARRNTRVASLDEAAATIRSLDIEAFRNLVDSEEEAFLRTRLPAREFRKIKRERAWAALAYVRALSDVSLQFARLGDAARQSLDPAVAESGKQLVSSALYLRLRTWDAGAQIIMSAAFPSLSPRSLRSLLGRYDRAIHLLLDHDTLNRVQRQAS